jgi:hypothetical protein
VRCKRHAPSRQPGLRRRHALDACPGLNRRRVRCQQACRSEHHRFASCLFHNASGLGQLDPCVPVRLAAGRRQSDGSVGDRQTELRGSRHLAVGHRHRCHARQIVQSIAVLTDRSTKPRPSCAFKASVASLALPVSNTAAAAASSKSAEKAESMRQRTASASSSAANCLTLSPRTRHHVMIRLPLEPQPRSVLFDPFDITGDGLALVGRQKQRRHPERQRMSQTCLRQPRQLVLQKQSFSADESGRPTCHPPAQCPEVDIVEDFAVAAPSRSRPWSRWI